MKKKEESHMPTVSHQFKSLRDNGVNDILVIRTEKEVADKVKTINFNGRIFAEVPDHGW